VGVALEAIRPAKVELSRPGRLQSAGCGTVVTAQIVKLSEACPSL
jgi:hypothetical protein